MVKKPYPGYVRNTLVQFIFYIGSTGVESHETV